MVVAAHRRPIGNKGRGTLGAQNPSPKCGPGAVGRRHRGRSRRVARHEPIGSLEAQPFAAGDEPARGGRDVGLCAVARERRDLPAFAAF